MLLINIVHALVNVVIANSTRIDLVSQATLSHGVVVTITIQAKDGLYRDQFPTTCFSLSLWKFQLEVFGCLHQ